MNYLISKVIVKEVLTENVVTVTEDTPIEEAALIMAKYKYGCLPVIRNDQLVGIITVMDLNKYYQNYW